MRVSFCLSHGFLFVVVAVYVLVLGSCGTHDAFGSWVSGPVGSHADADSLGTLVARNSCGSLEVKGPFANVTGLVSAPTAIGSRVSLFVANGTSFERALDMVRRCAPLGSAAVGSGGAFAFPGLPAGLYVAMVPRGSFGLVQGFPVVPRLNASGLAVDTAWHGGDSKHSMCVFTVAPIAS
jgi:hypothetical protein